jgi:hypothetical protein
VCAVRPRRRNITSIGYFSKSNLCTIKKISPSRSSYYSIPGLTTVTVSISQYILVKNLHFYKMGQTAVRRNVRGASHHRIKFPWSQMAVGRNVREAKCPCGRYVHGASARAPGDGPLVILMLQVRYLRSPHIRYKTVLVPHSVEFAKISEIE